ncbi:hypothetical protein ACFVGN_22615 [Streptomyces sp. NPDC057757]|uniref:hypothetical protein n=1 Tax=Streptomyces sp. NPDC057757 TaxID=3346241 RepID=UPI00368A7900
MESFVRGCGTTGDLSTWIRLHRNAEARAVTEEAARKVKVSASEADTSETDTQEEHPEHHQPRLPAALRKPVVDPQAVMPAQPDGLLRWYSSSWTPISNCTPTSRTRSGGWAT